MKNINKYGLRLKPNFDELILSLEADRPYRALPKQTIYNSTKFTPINTTRWRHINRFI